MDKVDIGRCKFYSIFSRVGFPESQELLAAVVFYSIFSLETIRSAEHVPAEALKITSL